MGYLLYIIAFYDKWLWLKFGGTMYEQQPSSNLENQAKQAAPLALSAPQVGTYLSREESSPVCLHVNGISEDDFIDFLQRLDFGPSPSALAFLYQSVEQGSSPDVARLNLDHIENDGEVSIASHAVFVTGNGKVEKFASVVLYDDLNGGTNLKLTLSQSLDTPDAPVHFKVEWCDYFLEHYGAQCDIRWDIIDTLFDIVGYPDENNLFPVQSEEGSPKDGRVSLYVEARNAEKRDFLLDPHLARHKELLRFILGKQHLPPTMRALGQQVRIMGMYPSAESEDLYQAAMPPLFIAESAEDSLSLGFKLASQGLSDAVPVAFYFYRGMMLPITHATTEESFLEDVAYLTSLEDTHVEVGNDKSVTLPTGLCYAPGELVESDPEFAHKSKQQQSELEHILEGFGINCEADLVQTLQTALVQNLDLSESDLLNFIIGSQPAEVVRTTIRNLHSTGFENTAEQIEIRLSTPAGQVCLTLHPNANSFDTEFDDDFEDYDDELLEEDEEEEDPWCDALGVSEDYSMSFEIGNEDTSINVRVSFDIPKTPYPHSSQRAYLWESIDRTAKLLGVEGAPEDLRGAPRVEESPTEIELSPQLSFSVYSDILEKSLLGID